MFSISSSLCLVMNVILVWPKKICQCYLSGQIIATSHDLTPRGSRGRESPLILGKSRLVNKMIWPDLWRGERSGMVGVFSDQSGALWGLHSRGSDFVSGTSCSEIPRFPDRKFGTSSKSHGLKKTLGWRWLLPTWKERNFVSQWGFQRENLPWFT